MYTVLKNDLEDAGSDENVTDGFTRTLIQIKQQKCGEIRRFFASEPLITGLQRHLPSERVITGQSAS